MPAKRTRVFFTNPSFILFVMWHEQEDLLGGDGSIAIDSLPYSLDVSLDIHNHVTINSRSHHNFSNVGSYASLLLAHQSPPNVSPTLVRHPIARNNKNQRQRRIQGQQQQQQQYHYQYQHEVDPFLSPQQQHNVGDKRNRESDSNVDTPMFSANQYYDNTSSNNNEREQQQNRGNQEFGEQEQRQQHGESEIQADQEKPKTRQTNKYPKHGKKQPISNMSFSFYSDSNDDDDDDDDDMQIDWQYHYGALRCFIQEHGHSRPHRDQLYECDITLPPQLQQQQQQSSNNNNDEDQRQSSSQQQYYHYSGNLGRWLDDQRKAYKTKLASNNNNSSNNKTQHSSPSTSPSNNIHEQRIALLQQLVEEGLFVWDASEQKVDEVSRRRSEKEWYLHFQALLHYSHSHLGGYCGNIAKSTKYKCELTLPSSVFGEETSDNNNNNNNTTTIAYEGFLGRWLEQQRQYKAENDKQKQFSTTTTTTTTAPLTAEREQLLQELVDQGKFAWSLSEQQLPQDQQQQQQQRQINLDMKWLRSFEALLLYYDQYHTYNVPDKKKFECVLSNGEMFAENLGSWLSYQRLLYHGKRQKQQQQQLTLAPDRQARLQQLVDQGKLRW